MKDALIVFTVNRLAEVRQAESRPSHLTPHILIHQATSGTPVE